MVASVALRVVLVVGAACLAIGQVEPAGDGAAEPKKMTTAQKLAKLQCEMAIAEADKATLDYKLKNDQLNLKLVGAITDNRKAKEKYLLAKRKGANVQRRKFGAEFLALKEERKKVAAQDKKDAKYKEEYVELYHKLKDSRKTAVVTKADIDKNLEQMESWNKDIVGYDKDMKVENMKIEELKKSLPLKKKALDIEYARRIIAARQRHQKEKEATKQEEQRSNEVEHELMPLLKGLHPLQERITEANRKITAAKVRARSLLLKMVGEVKELDISCASLKHTIRTQTERLKDVRHKEARHKSTFRAKQDEEEAKLAEEQKAMALRLKAAAEAHEQSAERNAAEEQAFRASMKAIQDTKAELTAKLSDLKTNMGTQVQSVEEKEEASVEAVKENYSKKLEAVKQASKLKASGGNAAGPGVAQAVKMHEEMKKVEEKLRKKMPTSS